MARDPLSGGTKGANSRGLAGTTASFDDVMRALVEGDD